MGGLYSGGEEQGDKSGYSCGRQLPGAAVGQPHLPSVACRNRNFELLIFERTPPPDNRTRLVTHCVSCHAQDTLRLLMTNAGGKGTLLQANQFPHLMAQKAQPNMAVCATCNQYRFQLIDDGNEFKRRCAYCQDTQHLGYETKAGSQGKQGRTFTIPPG